MEFLYLKAVHIVVVVTWFSGLFYLGRLLVYNREAEDKSASEASILHAQLNIMIRRLLMAITWPSAILVLGTGFGLAAEYVTWPVWLMIKIALVCLLFLYHLSLHRLARLQRMGRFGTNSRALRLWNEVPTVFLVAIVFLVVVRSSLSPVYGVLGLIGLVILLMAAVRVYGAIRKGA